MPRWKPEQYGTVNIGVPTITGKQSPDPRGQELMIPPEEFVTRKGEPSPAKVQAHERIKQLIGEKKMKPKAARKMAMDEARRAETGDQGTISPKEIYRYKYQAEQPGKQMTPFRTQEQNFPFI